MPDVLIDGTSFSVSGRFQTAMTVEAIPGTYYQFYLGDNTTLVYRKSDDNKVTWGAEVTIRTDALEQLNKAVIWYDRWTQGNTGSLIHIFYIARDGGAGATSTREYCNLNTVTDVLSTPVSVGAGGVAAATTWAASCITMTKTRAGNLYIGGIVDTGGGDHWLLCSTDDGLTWTAAGALASMADAGSVDKILFLYGNLADSDDFWCVFLDRDVPELTIKTYDASGDNWSESAAVTFPSALVNDDSYFQFAAAIRHSDGYALIPIWSEINSATADYKIFEWDGTIGTALTNMRTNQNGGGVASITIDQRNGDIYCGELVVGTLWEDTVNPRFFRSQNGGVSWSSTIYNQDGQDDFRWISCDPSPPAGGSFALVWRNNDLSDILTNMDNEVQLAGGPLVDEVTLGLTYTPVFGGSSFDVQLDLLVTTWKQTINTSPVVMPLTGFQSKALSLSKVTFIIELEGIAALMHPPHPLTASVEHLADDIDLEEAAILFSKELPENRATLTQRLYSDTQLTRSYDGTIESLVLFQEGGRPEWRFKLRFGVAWNSSRPALREWA